MKKAFLFLAGILMVLFCLQASGGMQQGQGRPSSAPFCVPTLPSARMDANFGKVPLQFIPNQGQTDERVAYYVQGRDKTIYFTAEGLTFVLAAQTREDGKKQPGPEENSGPEPTQRWVVKLDFMNSNPEAKLVGLEKSGAVISYFKGKPEEWKAGIPAYSKIIYRELWPGIDLLYYGTFNRMKYEFIVHPGADPSLIKLAYRGAEKLSLTAEGGLEVKTTVGSFEDDDPVAYQEADGERISVPVTYDLEDNIKGQSPETVSGPVDTQEASAENRKHVYGFQLGEYDRSRTLVLDPAVIVYCGYIGGTGMDIARGLAVDGSGNAYVTGDTDSNETTFPVAVGPDITFNGGQEIFIAKVNAEGTALIYCGYIGGSLWAEAGGVAVDGSGNAYVVGFTNSSDFPVKVGPDLTHNGGDDAFVAKVNAAGTALEYCGYIGGSAEELVLCGGIAVDGLGNAYVSGFTYSSEASFPVTVGPDLTFNAGVGKYDAFVAKVNAAGSALEYCGYIGGSESTRGYAIAVDGSGNAYVTGLTGSSGATFPVTVGPDLTYNGWGDAFIAKINASGTALIYCGYIGGAATDRGLGLAVDDSGNAYVAGRTDSSETSFPVTVGPDLTYNGGIYDGFVAKINAGGTALEYCGYIGGSNDDGCYGIRPDGSGNVYVAGFTSSDETSFPVTAGPDLTYNGGIYDGFVAKINTAGTALIYCGYIGGSDDDNSGGLAVDGSGNAYVAGYTVSTESSFPIIKGPGLTQNGGTDAFVAKLSWRQLYSFSGFDQPVDNQPAVNIAKAGSAIPVKWRIADPDGTPISDPVSFKSLTSYRVDCESIADPADEEMDEPSAGASGLQYLGDGCWQFNWKTNKSYAGQCRIMVLKLGDGSEHTASFKFK